MISAVRDFTNRLLGRGDATIAVPSFDGALKPNQLLETAQTILECASPEDLAVDGTTLFCAEGVRLLRLDGTAATEVRSFDRPISALAALPGGGVAVALGGREVRVYSSADASAPSATFTGGGMNAVNALAAAADGALFATDGSAIRAADDWARDLMELGRSGRVWRLDPVARSAQILASGLQYAFGACATADEVVVSESWRHRLVGIGRNGAKRTLLHHLPIYPSRLSQAAGGGYWLTAFTARTLLVEFVLREPAYRRRMMAEIDPVYWVAPRLRSGQSFKEPLQGGHIRTMGIIKPWAPPRSYGLVIRLNADCEPLFSLHSRVDGENHGIVAAVEFMGDLIMIAKGPGRVLKLPLAAIAKEFER